MSGVLLSAGEPTRDPGWEWELSDAAGLGGAAVVAAVAVGDVAADVGGGVWRGDAGFDVPGGASDVTVVAVVTCAGAARDSEGLADVAATDAPAATAAVATAT